MTTLNIDSVDETLTELVRERLEAVEVELYASIQSKYPFVTQASKHLVDAGGKRFRPLLAILAAQFGQGAGPDVVSAAVACELTHLATLYHDDVMDEADMRRGATSANARWDNTVAILTGDFLFAKTSGILATLGPEAVAIQAYTFERLCIGQIKESVGPMDGEDPVEHHIAVLADKTGSLIATSARLGSLMAGADRTTVDKLTEFGELIGIAFQLADDVVDILSESEQSGKTPGTDLREGVPTLATLIAQRSTDPADARLLELLGRPLPDDDDHAEALALLRAHASVGEAVVEARRWADMARASLSDLADIPARAALETLCDYVVSRTG